MAPQNGFVTEIAPSGSSLVYSTYLGGSGGDVATGIAVDGARNTYVTGNTSSADFPTKNPRQPRRRGRTDAFVTKIATSGSSLVYSSYLGGGSVDVGEKIAVDGAGNAYVTGYTYSTNFPIKNAIQPLYGGGSSDAFVTAVAASGSSVLYSTYLGGISYDFGDGIAVDGAGNAYVVGHTDSSNFPTKNPIQPVYGGNVDAFVTEISPG